MRSRYVRFMRAVDVTRTYLQLTAPETGGPADAPPAGAEVTRETPCSPALYRQLYGDVGRAYAWTDRLGWSDETLASHLSDPRVAIWTLRVSGELAGFFELKREEDGATEIAYFGILPSFHRRGLGKYLLTRAVHEAWQSGATRVWLHTCTLDDPAALPNYRARGFVPYQTEHYVAHLAD